MQRLLADPHPDVIQRLLAQPARARGRRGAPGRPTARRGEVLAEIARSTNWVHRPRVRMALVLNPATPAGDCGAHRGPALAAGAELVAGSPHVPAAVRALCIEHLERRPPVRARRATRRSLDERRARAAQPSSSSISQRASAVIPMADAQEAHRGSFLEAHLAPARPQVHACTGHARSRRRRRPPGGGRRTHRNGAPRRRRRAPRARRREAARRRADRTCRGPKRSADVARCNGRTPAQLAAGTFDREA